MLSGNPNRTVEALGLDAELDRAGGDMKVAIRPSTRWRHGWSDIRLTGLTASTGRLRPPRFFCRRVPLSCAQARSWRAAAPDADRPWRRASPASRSKPRSEEHTSE